MMRSVSFALAVALVYFAGAANASAENEKQTLKVGDAAPVVLGLYSDGDASLVRPWKWSGRVTLLVFWSPEDKASLEQLEELRRLHREYGDHERFQIVSLGTVLDRKEAEGADWDAWATFIHSQAEVIDSGGKRRPFYSAWHHLFEAELFDEKNFPRDKHGLTSSGRYAVSKLPAAFLIGADGRLAAIEISIKRLRDAVAAVLAGRAVEVDNPDTGAMQELFDLRVRQTRLKLELDYVEKRMAALEKEQFARFDRVADPIGSEYWESVSDMVLKAKANQNIRSDELLLYHAPGIYRVGDSRPKLRTKGECWYFRPDRDIRKGEEFSVVLVYDAPEELELKAKGFFPLTSRARDPERAYKTEIHIPGRPRGR